MQECELTKKDLYLLEEIVKYAKLIDKHTDILYQMELKGEKNSEEYKKELKNIKVILDFEDDKYAEASLDGEKSIFFIKYLVEDKCSGVDFLKIDELLFDDGTNRAIKRVLIKLSEIIATDYKFLTEHPDPGLLFVLRLHGVNPTEEVLTKIFKDTFQTSSVIDNDIINASLFLIEEYIKDDKFTYLKKEFTEVKYNLLMFNKDVENSMLKTDSNENTTTLDATKKISESLELPQEIAQRIKDKYCSDIVKKQIDDILMMTDTEYMLMDNSKPLLMRLILLRSCFILMSDESLEEMNYAFHDKIIDTEYLQEHGNDHLPEAFITKAFLRIRNDKLKHNTKLLIKK